MTEKPVPRPNPPVEGLTVERWPAPSLADYRALYRRVGEDWLWVSRAVMEDDKLKAIIEDPSVEVYALIRNGERLGLLELDFREAGQCELAFFGLDQSLIGSGAGRILMNAAIDRAQLSDLALAGLGLTTGVTPVTLPGACDPAKLPSATLSDEEISKLLADAGATNIKLSLTTWNEESAPAQIAQIIQQQLQRFGITVEIKVVDDPAYVAEFYGSDQPATADHHVAHRGAREAGGHSIGCNIELPFEQGANPYVDTLVNFRYFFVRKTMFIKYSNAFIIFPGGFGTLDELFEALTLIQTGKIYQFPVILFGRHYWAGLVRWIQSRMAGEGKISPGDLDLLVLTDDPREAVQAVVDAHHAQTASMQTP